MEVLEQVEFDYTNLEAVAAFLSENEGKQKQILEFAAEYNDVTAGRKLRELQIGKREDYIQGAKTIRAEKLPIQYQKKIVKTAVSFLFGDAPDIRANDSENENAQKILKTIKDNRIYSKLQSFAESVMSTTMGVFIFSKEDDVIKSRLHDYKKGTFTPQYDAYGDLTAFYWGFKIGEVDHLWIFTPTDIHRYAGEGDLKYIETEAHDFGVIPVVFVEQEQPEWWDVKEMIDRLEMLQSKLAGTNNYFAWPILKLKGALAKNEKGEEESAIDISDDGKQILTGFATFSGQVVESDAEFLQRDTGVESIQLEVELLKEFIHSISQTPDLSFDNVKGIGAVSGRALELMLQDAINKAKYKKGAYETAINRIISVVKNGLKITDEDLSFDIEFNYSIPKDLKEEVEMLVTAAGNKPVMSQETATQNNPLVKNPAEELERLRAESVGSMGESYNL